MAYLDHAATTPMRPEARQALIEWTERPLGNPSGGHRLAADARRAIDDARDVFAGFCGFEPGDIVFTGGGTEADNLAVSGLAHLGPVVCAATEHHAVLEPVRAAGGTVIGVDRDGVVDLEALDRALEDGPALVSVMLANNETGVIQPVGDIVARVRAASPGTLVHTDAVQAAPWLDLPDEAPGVDLLSLSAHKFGGPQGVGLLAVRGDVGLRARTLGGGQERDRRAGTQNVAGIAAAAAAARAVSAHRSEATKAATAHRDRLLGGLTELDGVHVTAPAAPRLPSIAHLCIEGVDSEALLFLASEGDVQASAASSCASGAAEASHVLAAMGIGDDLAAGSLRLSVGWSTTDADIDRAVDVVGDAVERLRRFPG